MDIDTPLTVPNERNVEVFIFRTMVEGLQYSPSPERHLICRIALPVAHPRFSLNPFFLGYIVSDYIGLQELLLVDEW